jgi:hypothetical protein
MKQFLNITQLKLVNGGYLSNEDNKPVYHKEFVDLQNHAHYIITFANLAKTKNFKETKADSLLELRQEVFDFINKTNKVIYVNTPEKPKLKLTDSLKEEALAFMEFNKEKNNVNKVNEFLQQFNLLEEAEEFGLFFEDNIVKLNNIYTIDNIIEAVKEVIDLLD